MRAWLVIMSDIYSHPLSRLSNRKSILHVLGINELFLLLCGHLVRSFRVQLVNQPTWTVPFFLLPLQVFFPIDFPHLRALYRLWINSSWILTSSTYVPCLWRTPKRLSMPEDETLQQLASDFFLIQVCVGSIIPLIQSHWQTWLQCSLGASFTSSNYRDFRWTSHSRSRCRASMCAFFLFTVCRRLPTAFLASCANIWTRCTMRCGFTMIYSLQ